MAKITEIKSILTGMASKAPVAVADTGKETAINSPIKKEVTPVRNELSNFLSTLVEGKDFGHLPNVQKPVLFKQGALKILKFFKYRKTMQLVDKTISATNQLIAYTVLVSVINIDGDIVSQALGSANTHESKFIKNGMSADTMLVNMAAKRALIEAVKELMV